MTKSRFETGWATMTWARALDGTLVNMNQVATLRLQNNGPEWMVWAQLPNGESHLLGRYGSVEDAERAMLEGPT